MLTNKSLISVLLRMYIHSLVGTKYLLYLHSGELAAKLIEISEPTE